MIALDELTLTALTAQERRELATVKRFLEYVSADAAVRERLQRDPGTVGEMLGMDVDAEALRPLWDPTCLNVPGNDVVRHCRNFIGAKLKLREAYRNGSAPAHPRMRQWRERQMARCSWELSDSAARAIVHVPFAVELSRGCSVGCWFCAVGAAKLSDHWRYDEASGRLWRGMLDAIGAVLGDAAAYGFLYWATDPLDNPDYEKFCVDFADRYGRLPQTTTAIPLRDAARTRALLSLSAQRGSHVNRFSILSSGQLRRLFAEFTPEELLFVELVLHNSGSPLERAWAGRAREREAARPAEASRNSTIACVSGFLVNALDRTLKLISPCCASDEWPLGYRVHASGTYETADEFAALLAEMTSTRLMPAVLNLDRRLRFRPDVTFRKDGDAFELVSPFRSARFVGISELGRKLHDGRYTALEIAAAFGDEEMPQTMYLLEDFHQAGLLDESGEPFVR